MGQHGIGIILHWRESLGFSCYLFYACAALLSGGTHECQQVIYIFDIHQILILDSNIPGEMVDKFHKTVLDIGSKRNGWMF